MNLLTTAWPWEPEYKQLSTVSARIRFPVKCSLAAERILLGKQSGNWDFLRQHKSHISEMSCAQKQELYSMMALLAGDNWKWNCCYRVKVNRRSCQTKWNVSAFATMLPASHINRWRSFKEDLAKWDQCTLFFDWQMPINKNLHVYAFNNHAFQASCTTFCCCQHGFLQLLCSFNLCSSYLYSTVADSAYRLGLELLHKNESRDKLVFFILLRCMM